jgi:agmatine deiminase
MTKIIGSTPRDDGYRMPGEFEPQDRVYMIWPERPDVWRDAAKPAQEASASVAEAISRFTPLTMFASAAAEDEAKTALAGNPRITVETLENDDIWIRDSGPTFIVNDTSGARGMNGASGVRGACGERGVRLVDWEFNAWGGDYDGLYSPWDDDNAIPSRIAERENIDYYSTPGFVLEGGSFHTDGEGTLLTTGMCLLSPGRNPHLDKAGIEEMLKAYINVKKIIWIRDGIDPDETNGHIDDVACFVRPGEVVCIYSEDGSDPFYEASRAAYDTLSRATDAQGRRLNIHKLAMPSEPIRIGADFRIAETKNSKPRQEGEICIASYANFLITNGGVIVPQYGDKNDALALAQISAAFPDHEAVGVYTREIAYGGGNIHCITQQQPAR